MICCFLLPVRHHDGSACSMKVHATTLLLFVALSVNALAFEILGTYNFARFASIEAKDASITWDPRLSFLPSNTNSFAQAQTEGAWASAQDGPGDDQEQVLLVRLVDPRLK
jgi:hypothetical protein